MKVKLFHQLLWTFSNFIFKYIFNKCKFAVFIYCLLKDIAFN